METKGDHRVWAPAAGSPGALSGQTTRPQSSPGFLFFAFFFFEAQLGFLASPGKMFFVPISLGLEGEGMGLQGGGAEEA